MLFVGPNEEVEGCYYIRKDGNSKYSLVRRYSKDKFNQHHKGDGSSDVYEVEYTSTNPNEFVTKVNNLKKSFLVETELSHVEKYERIPLNFKETEAKFANYDNESLLYTKKDIEDAIRAGESFAKEGMPYPKLGYYMDELHVINAEIRKRRDKGTMLEDGEGGGGDIGGAVDASSQVSQIVTSDMPNFYAYGGFLARPYGKQWKKKS